ncbi:hypothetical protein SDC9_208290 [bioreactor metagenome]|uniref:Uncharacterized protein n=1 Tax=bioreactor metagenome TaxID=1076179 RepID=A0A645JAC2_9ZZZZ
MKTCRRGGHRSFLSGIHRLISALIGKAVFAFDIGRQRHMTELHEKSFIKHLVETDGPGPIGVFLGYPAGTAVALFGVAEGIVLADMLLLGLGDHHIPTVVEILFQEEKFHPAACIAYSKYPCFAHFAVVYD